MVAEGVVADGGGAELTATGVPVSSESVGEVVAVTVATRHPLAVDWSLKGTQELPFHQSSDRPEAGWQTVIVREVKLLPGAICTS